MLFVRRLLTLREAAAEGGLEFVEGLAGGEGDVGGTIFPLGEVEDLAGEEFVEAGLGEVVALSDGAELFAGPEGAGVVGAGAAEELLAQVAVGMAEGVVDELFDGLGEGGVEGGGGG